MKILFIFLAMFIMSNSFAQISVSSKFGIRGNLSMYQDINVEGYNDTHSAYNFLTGLEVGYTLKKRPITFKTGLIFGKFSETFHFKNTITGSNYGVEDFGKIYIPYKVFEFPFMIDLPVYNFSEKLSLGVAFGTSIFLTNDEALFDGSADSIKVFSQEVNDFAKFEYVAFKIQYSQFGWALNSEINSAFALSNKIKIKLAFQYSLGLTPGQVFGFFYDISNSRFRNIGEAVTLSKWDNLSLSLGVQYSLRTK